MLTRCVDLQWHRRIELRRRHDPGAMTIDGLCDSYALTRWRQPDRKDRMPRYHVRGRLITAGMTALLSFTAGSIVAGELSCFKTS